MPVSMCFINILKNPLTCDVVVENGKKKIKNLFKKGGENFWFWNKTY